MKKKLIIFRFGSERPTRKEWDIITTITDGTNRAIGFGTIFGVGSIVETSYTPKQITSLFTRVADDTGDSLPVVVWDPAGDTGFNLHKDFFPTFAQANADFDSMYGNAPCTLSLDQLLELISNRGGVNHLTAEELKRLQQLSGK